MPPQFAAATSKAVPIRFVSKDDWVDFLADLPANVSRFVSAASFEPSAGRHLLVPDEEGSARIVIFAVEPKGAWADPFLAGKLVSSLPRGTYRFENEPHGDTGKAELAALGWLLSSYRFTRYKAAPPAESAASLRA